MTLLFLLLTRTLLGFFLHPFHVSVCDINYNETNKSLEITHRIFLDDLEATLRNYSGNTKLDVMKIEDKAEVNRLLESYFKEKFAVSANGQLLSFQYLGEEIEDDVMLCYIEIKNVDHLQFIEVESGLLIEIFPDQMNIVHIKAFGDTRSLRLREKDMWGEIKF